MERSDGNGTKPRPADPARHRGVLSLMSSTRCCIDCGRPLALVQNSNARYCYECRARRAYASKLKRARDYARNHREQMAAYQKERYEWLREKGFCISCGREKAEPGYVRCAACRAKAKRKKPVSDETGKKRKSSKESISKKESGSNEKTEFVQKSRCRARQY